ncbi:hypothetical protein XENTR_v10015372 [Xenopus tropicalis]|nr:hypothetical protein XENTR_v10015372 [Xenopus tropicalis]
MGREGQRQAQHWAPPKAVTPTYISLGAEIGLNGERGAATGTTLGSPQSCYPNIYLTGGRDRVKWGEKGSDRHNIGLPPKLLPQHISHWGQR